MMTRIREMSWIFFVVLILSFVGLMVFQWGMDYSGRKSQGSNVVGTVYNIDISYPNFEKTMRNAYENEKNRLGQAPSQERTEELKQTVWNQLVKSIILQREVEKRGITVSDDEVVLAIKAYFRTNESFQTNGVFDEAKWQEALSRTDIPWANIEAQFRGQLPMNKLEQMVVNSVYVGEAEVEETATNELTSYNINQLGVRFSEFEDRNAQVDSQEVLAYYNDHIEEYSQDEQRKLSYALFENTPTKDDTLLIYSDAKALYDRVKNGENINNLAKIYSEEPNAKETGGDLGWFSKGRMVKPFEDAVFSSKPGDVLGPIKTNFGYHVIYIKDRRKNDKGEVEYNVSHILLKIVPSRTTEDRLYAQANALIESGKEKEFSKAGQELGIPIKESNYFGKGSRFIPGIGNIPGAGAFAYNSDVGKVSRIYQTPRGYYVLSLSGVKEKGYKDINEVRAQIIRKLKNEKLDKLAANFLQKEVKPLLDKGMTFEQISKEDFGRKLIFNPDQSFKLSAGIPGIGRNPESTAKFLTIKENEFDGPISGSFASYYIFVVEKKSPTKDELKAQKKIVRQRILNTRRNQYYQKWYEQKLIDADVKDYRSSFNLI